MRRMKTCKEIQECANEALEGSILPDTGTIVENYYTKWVVKNKRFIVVINVKARPTSKNIVFRFDTKTIPQSVLSKIIRYDGTSVNQNTPNSGLKTYVTAVPVVKYDSNGDNGQIVPALMTSYQKDALYIGVFAITDPECIINARFELEI